MNLPIWKKKTEALSNKEFISIRAYSGYGYSCIGDFTAKEYLLDTEVNNELLGKSILESLKESRSLTLEEDNYLSSTLKNDHELWIKKIQHLYGCKTRKAMFRWMNRCSIKLDNSVIMIAPNYHERLEAWSGMDEEHTVKIPADSSPEDIGAALRLAFSRCKSKTF